MMDSHRHFYLYSQHRMGRAADTWCTKLISQVQTEGKESFQLYITRLTAAIICVYSKVDWQAYRPYQRYSHSFHVPHKNKTVDERWHPLFHYHSNKPEFKFNKVGLQTQKAPLLIVTGLGISFIAFVWKGWR